MRPSLILLFATAFLVKIAMCQDFPNETEAIAEEDVLTDGPVDILPTDPPAPVCPSCVDGDCYDNWIASMDHFDFFFWLDNGYVRIRLDSSGPLTILLMDEPNNEKFLAGEAYSTYDTQDDVTCYDREYGPFAEILRVVLHCKANEGCPILFNLESHDAVMPTEAETPIPTFEPTRRPDDRRVV